jgi:putative flippase GtrA
VRISRFAAVGAFCALLTNLTVIVLVRVGLSSTLASVISFVPVLVIGYALHTVFTFGAPASRGSFLRYTLSVASNFPIWIASLYLLCNVLAIPVTIAAPVATACIFVWNYTLMSWAFRRRGSSQPKSP